ncbi:hypothetical protein [Massilia eburnea]|nr:hypothetical protein [Massilia eburnea]
MLPILILALATSANARDGQKEFFSRFVPQWQAICQIPGHRFQLQFSSKGGDPTNDDMTASVSWDNGSASELPIKPALFVADAPKVKEPSQCDHVSAFLQETGNVLVVLRRDDRPSSDRYLAVLLDGNDGKVHDVLPDLGAIRDDSLIKVDKHGVSIHLGRTQAGNSDANRSSEWVRIEEVQGRLSVRLGPPADHSGK